MSLAKAAKLVDQSFHRASSHHVFGFQLPKSKFVLATPAHGFIKYDSHNMTWRVNDVMLQGFKDFDIYDWKVHRRYINGGGAANNFFDLLWCFVDKPLVNTHFFIPLDTNLIQQPVHTMFFYSQRFDHNNDRTKYPIFQASPAVLNPCPNPKKEVSNVTGLLEAYDFGTRGFSGTLALSLETMSAQGIYIGRPDLPKLRVPLGVPEPHRLQLPDMEGQDAHTKHLVTLIYKMLEPSMAWQGEQLQELRNIAVTHHNLTEVAVNFYKRRALVLPGHQMLRVMDDSRNHEALADVVHD